MANKQEPKAQHKIDAVTAELRWQSLCLSVLATATAGIMLYLLRQVLIPFVVAVFLTVGLTPILDVLQRSLLPSRVAAVTTAFLLGVLLLLLLVGTVTSSIDQLAHDDAYQRRAVAAAEMLAPIAERLGLFPKTIPESDSKSPSDSQQEEASTAAEANASSSKQAGASQSSQDESSKAKEQDATSKPEGPSTFDKLRVAVQSGAASAEQWLLREMASLSSSLGVVLIYMFFLLLGASGSARGGELWEMIEGKLREYIVLKTVISIGTGIAVWFVLAIFRVPLALVMGLLTFLLNYIPNFGPLVTCVLPLPLIWLSPNLSLWSMIIASVLTCGVQLVSGNVIEPRIMGSSFALHPIVVLLALMLWFAIWGFVGMLLAVPMTAALKVILERIERTRPIARLMAGDLTALSVEATQ